MPLPWAASGRKRLAASPSVKVYAMLSFEKIGASSSKMVSFTLSGPMIPWLFVAAPDSVTLFSAPVNTSSSTATTSTGPPLEDVWPAGMIRVFFPSLSLNAANSAGEADTITVVSTLDLLSRVAVTEIQPSPSTISGDDSDSVTTGVVSSSATARATGSGSITTSLPAVAETVTLTSPVRSSLSTPVIVTLSTLTVWPAGMVSVLFVLRATASEGEADTVTTVSALDGLCSEALTVLTPPFSASQYLDIVSPTLGVGEDELRRKFAVISRLSFSVFTAWAGPSTPVDGWSTGTPIGSPL